MLLQDPPCAGCCVCCYCDAILQFSGDLAPAVPGNMNELSTEAALSSRAELAAEVLQTDGIAQLRSIRGEFWQWLTQTLR